MVRAYRPLLDELGLTYPQYVTMLVLWEADDGVSVGDLGARLHLDSGTLSPLIKRLEQLGFVDRRRDPADERRVIVEVTEQGATLRTQACEVPARMAQRIGLAPDSFMRLRDDLAVVAQTLEANTDIP